MASRRLSLCTLCGATALPEHRGESSDGAQHYDLHCGKGHFVQLHFLTLGTYWAGVSVDDVKPHPCSVNCQFHQVTGVPNARAAS
jgi:hypothetical protein